MKMNLQILGALIALLAFPCGLVTAATSTNAPDFTPSNPPAMNPILSHDTPAWRAAKLFQRGVNLGDYLEAPRQYFGRGVTVSAAEFAEMKREGFDHLRVPIGWHQYAGAAPDFTLAPEIFSRADFIVTNALANQLAVMINLHHFNELDHDPGKATDEFLAIWRQIAAHYKDFPAQLVFEWDNEPHENATTGLMNPIYARAIAEIRQSNPQRTIVVEPGGWGGINELNQLVLPPDDNVMVSVHCYEPFHFTHQGAGWVGADFKQTGIIFPGPPAQPLVPDMNLNPKPHVLAWFEKYNTLPADKNPSGPAAFRDKLRFVHAWSDHYGYPVHLGEFGAYIKADPASRANFYATFRRAAAAENLGWCIWDWSANFRYWDKTNNCPLPGMHAALFGN